MNNVLKSIIKYNYWNFINKIIPFNISLFFFRIYTLSFLKKRKEGPSMKKFQKKTEDCFLLLHLGYKPVPDYVIDSIKQIRIYSNNQIIFGCTKSNYDFCKKIGDICDIVFVEDIPATNIHKKYAKKISMKGFAFWTTERFFVIEEYILNLKLKNIVHIENDNLIYGDVHSAFKNITTGNNLTITRHNNTICIGGIIFIPSVVAISKFTDFLTNNYAGKYINDMDSLSVFSKISKVDYAPVVSKEYKLKHEFKSLEGEIWDRSYDISAYTGKGNTSFLFDGASLGQFIGGVYNNSSNTQEFINKNCLYNPSFFDIHWECNEKGWEPYLFEGKKKYKIMNLHIHSKQLYKYRSDNKDLLKNIVKNNIITQNCSVL